MRAVLLTRFMPKIENARDLAASGAFRMIFSSMDQCIVSFCLSMRLRVARFLNLPAPPGLRLQVAPSPLPFC